MKKKTQPVQKPKEFVSRPFGSLKEVRTEQMAEPPRAKPPRQAPTPDVTPDDAELFLRAMGDTRRVHTDQSKTGTKPAVPRRSSAINEDERAYFLKALENLQLDVKFADDAAEEDDAARPFPVNRLREVKRGAIRLDLQLDLHGLTRDEALQSLAEFVGGAYQRGQKAVLVITGKGYHSPGDPVLQGAVTGWLRNKGKEMVVEFTPAPREMGGSGAFVVFLREPVAPSEKSDEGDETAV